MQRSAPGRDGGRRGNRLSLEYPQLQASTGRLIIDLNKTPAIVVQKP
jgi:hypothetical protein